MQNLVMLVLVTASILSAAAANANNNCVAQDIVTFKCQSKDDNGLDHNSLNVRLYELVQDSKKEHACQYLGLKQFSVSSQGPLAMGDLSVYPDIEQKGEAVQLTNDGGLQVAGRGFISGVRNAPYVVAFGEGNLSIQRNDIGAFDGVLEVKDNGDGIIALATVRMSCVSSK